MLNVNPSFAPSATARSDAGQLKRYPPKTEFDSGTVLIAAGPQSDFEIESTFVALQHESVFDSQESPFSHTPHEATEYY